MKSLIIAAVAVAALSFGTTTAMAEHRHHSYHRYGCAPYATPYEAYRYSPSYSNRYYGYRSPYYGHSHVHSYRYGYPAYGGSSIGVHGRNFSFHIGF